jgi:hypothetical protein
VLTAFPPVDSWVYVPMRVETPPSGPWPVWRNLYGRVVETDGDHHVRVAFLDGGPPMRLPVRWVRPASIIDLLASLEHPIPNDARSSWR